MRDFPPVVPEFTATASTGPGPTVRASAQAKAQPFVAPDTRSPTRYLWWLLGQQWPVLVVSSVLAMLEWLPGAVGPFLVGRIIDQGIIGGDWSAVWRYAGGLLGLALVGVTAGVLGHTYVVRSWLIAMYRSMKLVTRKTTQMGHVLPQRVPTGEVLSVAGGDSDQMGALTEVLTRAVGALLAYLMIAAIVLHTSLQLGLVVLLAAPLLVILAMPLLRPLERRQEAERTRLSELTSLATDIVAGLRILRGIGGEQTFAGNYAAQSQLTRRTAVSAGRWQAAVDATSVLFSGMFLVALTVLGSQQVAAGELEIGQLVSFFGYAVFMVWPIQTFFELAQKWVRAVVAARKTVAVMEQQPPWRQPAEPLVLPHRVDLHDQVSGFVAASGLLTALVSGDPEDSAALADRLGRYLPSGHDPVSLDVEKELTGRAARRARRQQRERRAELLARDAALAGRRWGVSLGTVDLADVPIADVRERIVVSHTAAVVFAGTLQDTVDPSGRLTREQAEQALLTAAAEDVFDLMPGGWQGVLDERGRGLSGGQRQRLLLARALAADPEILVLVEPTSAVDAHTEAMIASRLAQHRRGRTTVVMTGSPLLLHHADRVALLEQGRVIDVGTHEKLLARSAAYRHVVVRGLDDADPTQRSGAGDD
ncbi:MAG: ABC transporter ATP-binding protein/permease [Microlunatus sp.]|nr:ABC transporter ATP-binding protein/permease [Microlunatus sp.]